MLRLPQIGIQEWNVLAAGEFFDVHTQHKESVLIKEEKETGEMEDSH
jgi:hypothetical protein